MLEERMRRLTGFPNEHLHVWILSCADAVELRALKGELITGVWAGEQRQDDAGAACHGGGAEERRHSSSHRCRACL